MFSSDSHTHEGPHLRLEIQERLKPVPGKRMSINERARITGIGFFNHVHGQWGIANGLELSPYFAWSG